MILNDTNLQQLFRGFNTSFNKGFQGAPSTYREIAMVIPSITESTTYGWLGDMPGIREWLGDRVVHNLSTSSYKIENKRFEMTIAVPRTKIEDDQYGIFGPMFQKMGDDTARHPDELVYSLLSAGFTTECFDGQYFFDADHPVGDADHPIVSVSNVQAGAGPAWFLLDCSQPIKPMIYQERTPFDFQRVDDPNDAHVFFKDQYAYGVRGRSNVGFGLWQLGFASKDALNAANYANARAAMMSFTKNNGKPLGVSPTHLVVPPALESQGRKLMLSLTKEDGATNEWAGSAKLIVTSFL